MMPTQELTKIGGMRWCGQIEEPGNTQLLPLVGQSEIIFAFSY